MRRLLIGLFIVISVQAQEHLVPLTVLHWNDFHARNVPYTVTIRDTLRQRDTTYLIGGSATLLAYINKFRSQSGPVLVLNGGDDFQGTPISTITKGRSQIDLMNIIQPDAMVLGNHEFDYGSRSLLEHLKEVSFSVLAANLWDSARNREFVSAANIKRFSGMTIGILGLSPPDLDALVVRDSIRDIRLLPVDSVVAVHVREFRRDGVDLIVVLSHMGSSNDEKLALLFPQIDLIVGGHDHRPIRNPIRVGRTLIVQAGSYGRYLGKVDLIVDTRGDSVFSYRGSLIETRVSEVLPDPVAAKKVEEFEDLVGDAMKEVIGELLTPWTTVGYGRRAESNIGNWQADVIRAFTESDVSFQNSGGIRDNLRAGPITVGDIWRISPFGNTFVRFAVSGAKLREMLEHHLASRLDERGHFGGMRMVFDSRKPTGSKLVEVTIGNKPLDDKRMYRFATNNYVVSNLRTHFGITGEGLTFERLPDLDRDVFIEQIRKGGKISSALDGRMKDVASE
ncbi:MAG: bifunctional metallophosphatase/5'-nucleotidase [Ignavibacteria bacterium]|nr:bifunctional metallophosphatase/5'-nucleotidase [Ignavibacteria bacterium]